MDAAKAFYAELFGWQWQGQETSQGGTYWMATLNGAPVAGLAGQPPEMAAQGVPSSWNTYINVDNLDDAVVRATGAGGEVIVPPDEVGESGRLAFVRDPGGATVGMWQAGAHKGAGLVNEPGTMIWNEVYAPDTEAEVAFYGKLFGWKRESMPVPGGPDYTMFLVGEAPIGGMYPPREGGPRWQVWFGSADIDANVARAQELGATIQVPPSDSPQGRMAFLVDPTGAEFSLITAG